MTAENLTPKVPLTGTTPMRVKPSGEVTLDVPNARIARLIQLGISEERKQRARVSRRKAAKQSRRRNRRSN